MPYETIRFEEIKARGSKNLACPRCGKKVRRSTTCTQTINPFNRNADGYPKTYSEVRKDVWADLRAWQAIPEKCRSCCDLECAARPPFDPAVKVRQWCTLDAGHNGAHRDEQYAREWTS